VRSCENPIDVIAIYKAVGAAAVPREEGSFTGECFYLEPALSLSTMPLRKVM